jgi:hypothetical protein
VLLWLLNGDDTFAVSSNLENVQKPVSTPLSVQFIPSNDPQDLLKTEPTTLLLDFMCLAQNKGFPQIIKGVPAMSFRTWLFSLLLLLPGSAWAQSATINASPNPCTLANTAAYCTSSITWSSNNAPNAGLFFGTILVGGTPSGTYTPNWINITGYTFDVRQDRNNPNSQLLASVFVRGVVPAPPSGSVSASPNPCSIATGGSSCTSSITWTSSNAPGAGLFFGTTLVGGTPSGTYTPNWITTGGFTFDLRTDHNNPFSQLLASIFVYGQVAAPPPSATIAASPNPCVLATPVATCTSTISWTSTNAPNAGLFLSSTLVGNAASGSYTTSTVNVTGLSFKVRLDRNNANSQTLVSLLVIGVVAVDLRSYFPATTNTYRMSDGRAHGRYNFFFAQQVPTDPFWSLYTLLFDLRKPGANLLIWQKIYASDADSPENLNCTATYGHLVLGAGSDKSVVEVGDWLNSDGNVRGAGGVCPNQYGAFGYQKTDTFGLPATGLNWSGVNGLASSFSSSQLGYVFRQNPPSTSYVLGSTEYSSPTLVQFLSSWQAPYGRKPNNGTWGAPGKVYTNVVRMILYHGVLGGTNPCPLHQDNPLSGLYIHRAGYNSYAVELYMDQLHGVLQQTLLYDETGYWFPPYVACDTRFPALAPIGNSLDLALGLWRAYIDR